MTDSAYGTIAVAATFSPRFHRVLAEANRMRKRFESRLSLIFVGRRTAQTEAKFAEAINKLALPGDSLVHYAEGDPARGILTAAEQLGADLLIAGALEKEAVHRQFLGNVARRLVREADRSVMLFTQPKLEPKPLRHIVFMAEYSEHAQQAFRHTLRLAEKENCERLYVIRNYTSFDKARAARRRKGPAGNNRTLEEEEIALQEFVLAAGSTAVPIEARCIRGNTGFAASNFVQAVEANLLVVPIESKAAAKPALSSRIAWVTDVIPCNLWIVR